MIEVKGTRTAAPEASATDPLGLRRDPNPDARILTGWVGGLVGLALYLKSFLWPGEAEASGAPAPPATPAAEDGKAPGTARHLRPVPDGNEQEPGDEREPAVHEAAAGRAALPQVFSPFDSGIFAPAPSLGSFLTGPLLPANAPFPPFRGAPGARLLPDPVHEDGPPGPDGAGALAFDDDLTFPPFEDDPGTGEDPGQSDGTDGGSTPETPARNRAPRNASPVYLGDVGSGATLAFALSHLLSQSSDPDGDSLHVNLGAASTGVIDGGPAGGWRYLADTDHLGEVTIGYMVSDGEFQVAQSAVLTIVENRRTGTEGDDLVLGTAGRDVIEGHGGDDNLAGLGGRDLIDGGAGDDNIAGGDGDDTLLGGAGDDMIAGGAGDDWIAGGAGNDRLYGEAGDDVIYGDDGEDYLEGGDGDDLLFGGEGHDFLDGGEGADVLSGGAGDDTLLGGAGDDILIAGVGSDFVMAGEGDDTVFADDDGSNDIYDGGEGYDRLDYSAATEGVTIDIPAGTATGLSVGEDSFTGFEHFVGSATGDVFRAGPGEGTFTGNGGNDLYDFLPGDTVETGPSLYRITDFSTGDLIQFGSLFGDKKIGKAQKALEDRIEDFFEDFADSAGADEPRLRYWHDWTEDYCRTLVEVDFDRDKTVDVKLVLDGEHVLIFETA